MEPGHYTRTYYWKGLWPEQYSVAVESDAVGNLIDPFPSGTNSLPRNESAAAAGATHVVPAAVAVNNHCHNSHHEMNSNCSVTDVGHQKLEY
jgi:hypothetical protein